MRLGFCSAQRACAFTLLLAACGGDDGGDGGGDDNLDDSPADIDAAPGEAIVNGKPASEYYGQFAWEVTGSYAYGGGAFAAQADGRNAYIASVFLYQDGTSVLFYAEGDFDVSPDGFSGSRYPGASVRRNATWSIDGAQLLIGDDLQCDGVVYNGEEVLHCELARAIDTSAAVGQSSYLRRSGLNSTPDDSEWADYE